MGLLEELRNNRRLRYGLALVVCILFAYGLLEWRDQQEVATADYRRLLNQVARLSQHKEPAQWQQRASEAVEALRQARGQLWHHTSTGLAQAQVQDWLNALLRQTEAKGGSVRVAEPETAADAQVLTARLPAELKSLQPLRARIEFNTEPAVLLTLLAALNDSPQRVVVDALNVKPLKTDVVLTFWFDIGPSVGGGT